MRDIQNVIDVAQQATELRQTKINGRDYARKGELELVVPPEPACLSIHTLQGVVDYIKEDPDEYGEGQLYVQILGYGEVSVRQAVNDHAQRLLLLKAKADERWSRNYQVGRYYLGSDFVIWLLQSFAPSDDRGRLLALVSKLKAEKVVGSDDDGLSQTVATRQGIKSSYEGVKNPHILRPYRTFAEIDAPNQTFIVRFQDGGDKEPPKIALFDADSGAWEIEAINRIRTWLKTELPETKVIG